MHTHTVSDITDFPAYGNAAGTICEGNDARLSDARTPVAHMHTKSDVTDLFNSANTWTGDNTFSNTLNGQTGYALGILPQAESAVALFTGRATDNNFVTNINFYQNPTRGTGLRFTIRNKWDNSGYSTTGTTRNAHFELLQSTNKTAYMQWEGYVNNGLYPLANNVYDLGSSSYQWNNLYAKNYYYNGVAWGLDKINTWSAHQKIVGSNSRGTVSIYNPAYTKGSALSATELAIGTIYMGNNGQIGLANSLSLISTDVASNGARNSLSLSAMENTASSTARANVAIQYDKNDAENPRKVIIQGSALPQANATYSLGTSTNKWKSFNGINPGALSLPNTYINLDTTNWNLTGTLINYTPTTDGWLFINIRPDNNYAYVAIEAAHMRNNSENTTGKNAMACIAVRANIQVSITLIGASIAQARLVNCAGNV